MNKRTIETICFWIFKVVALWIFFGGYFALKRGELADGILMLTITVIILIGIATHRICSTVDGLKEEMMKNRKEPDQTF